MRPSVSLLLTGGIASLSLLLPGCSGGSSDSDSGGVSSGAMFVQTCSLGCSSGAGGEQVSCAIVATSVNNEFSIYFSEDVDANSISSTTFQLIDVNSGQVPVGTRFVDPANLRRVVFRPLITFDPTGNPIFGLDPNTTYRVTIPGEAQGDSPPFIMSRGAKPNRSRMQCDIQTTGGVIDLVPGAPLVTLQVDLAITATPDPNDRIPNQPADGATDVWRNSTIRMIFNDVMNPVTLLNQVTHQATFITVKVDPDGNLATDDVVDFPGSYSLELDLDNLRTILTFTSPTGMPSGGALGVRKVLVNVPTNVQDLSGNGLANPGQHFFIPETTFSDPVTLPDADGENFDTVDNLNANESSADWGGGRLVRGFGGGSGRLGKLVVRAGETLTLNTDSQAFPLPNQPRDLLDNTDPVTDYDPLDREDWPGITITDGAFEFSSITIDAGGTLVLTGTRHARLFSRGTARIQGTIDVRGVTPAAFDSFTTLGQPGGAGGPGAGDGGGGGDRVDNSGSTSPTLGLLTIVQTPATLAAGTMQGIVIPGSDVNGRPSEGVDQIQGGLGAAAGGHHYPAAFPTTRETVPPGSGDLLWTIPDPDVTACFVQMVSHPGGGGGYGTAGTNGQPNVFFLDPEEPFPDGANLPPQVAGDANGDGGPGGTGIGLEDPDDDPFLRKLAVENGALRGGAGGGGGGTSLFNSHNNTSSLPCTGPAPPNNHIIDRYYDSSACAGGGGGGALQVVSGKNVLLNGVLDARGGNGGSAIVLPIDLLSTVPPIQFNGPNADGRRNRAAPGGGGSGGAVRLQGQVVQIDGNVTPGIGRANVTGGVGGTTDFCDGTVTCAGRGGNGGAGLIRLEDLTGLLTRAGEAPKLLPFNAATDPESKNWLSVGIWALPRRRPESFTGAVSCWMRPTGNFFELSFTDDDLSNPDENEHTFGWNMEVLYDDGGPLGERPINYRGPDTDSPFDDDLETVLHNNLNYGLPAGQRSYFAVRFQGAVLLSSYAGSLCDVDLNTEVSTQHIADNSLTPWVRHPADLNSFSPRPNMIRFTIVFDTALEIPGSVPSFVKGIRNLKIDTQPD